jgi:predicted Zn-dependent protease
MTMAPRRPVHCPLARRLLTALLAAGLTCTASAQQDVRLPDLGSSANALISPQEAQDYGAAMLHQMRALDLVVDDPLLDDYINDLGFRLVASSDKPKEHFAFFVVRDPEINAFAAPGGYIAVNSGLITITRNESELAGVMAHEIGHITQNHLERAFEDSKKDAPLMALVLLGAILAGAGGHAGDAPVAVLAGGQSLIAQKSINFTRHDEIEADRVGIQTLGRAGFDPNAMATFFEHLEDVTSADAGGIQTPSLLQSHPVTTERISDAKSRAGALIAAQKLRPSVSGMDQSQWEKITAPVPFLRDPSVLTASTKAPKQLDTYSLMRERTRVLADDASKAAIYYASNLKNQFGFDTPATRYGYALALTRSAAAAVGRRQHDPETRDGRCALAGRPARCGAGPV